MVMRAQRFRSPDLDRQMTDQTAGAGRRRKGSLPPRRASSGAQSPVNTSAAPSPAATSRSGFSEEVRAALANAAPGANEDRGGGEAGFLLRRALADVRSRLTEQVSRGDVFASRYAAVMDEAVRILFAQAAGEAKGRLALFATGGFGRRSLAPFSDVDLLIVHGSVSDAVLRRAVDRLLYPLWDAGLKIGHGVHTPSGAVRFAANDLHAQTALLDARLIGGDASLAREFLSNYDQLRRRTRDKFVVAKLAEQEARHDRSAQSRYLAEPDLKEGKGGLRDLHTIGWIARHLTGKSPGEGRAATALIGAENLAAFIKAERFLMSLRVHLHQMQGRANEKLSFDLQPALAERLGYADRSDISSAERMMRHYFVNAIDVGRLTRIFVAKIESDRMKLSARAPTPLPKALAVDEIGGKPNLRIRNGRIDFQSAAAARREPVDLFRLFRAFSKRPDLDFHPDALALTADCVTQVTTPVRNDPAIARLFIAMLLEAREPVKLLRVMAETRLLGKYIPSFGQISGRVELGLYRRFTLDEHVFQAIGVLTKIRVGDLQHAHPIATSIITRSKSLMRFYLAVLLHEARGALKEQTPEAAEKLIDRVARRLGAPPDEAALISWVAARPLLMVRVSESRNLGDPRTIARFTREMESIERLELMLVLTVCHLRVVSEGAWDEWTRRQVSALYFGARAYLRGGEGALGEWMKGREAQTRATVGAALGTWSEEERRAFLARLTPEMTAHLDASMIARGANLVREAGRAARAAVAATVAGDSVEAIVYADDRVGLLADLAGAVASTGASVRNVHASAFADGKVFDAFTVQPPVGPAVEALPDLARRVHLALLEAAKATPGAPPTASRRIGDRRSLFAVASSVRIDLAASDDCLVVEAEGRDRPGLLHALASALSEIGVIIRSAHIATYGERAIDTFYLQDAPGYKITDRRRLQSIERRLLGVLSDGAIPQTPLTGAG